MGRRGWTRRAASRRFYSNAVEAVDRRCFEETQIPATNRFVYLPHIPEFKAHSEMEEDYDLVHFFEYFENCMRADARPEREWVERLLAQCRTPPARQFLQDALEPFRAKGLEGVELYRAGRDSLLTREESRYGPEAYMRALVHMLAHRTPTRTVSNYDAMKYEMDTWIKLYEAARIRQVMFVHGSADWPAYGTREWGYLFYTMCRTPPHIREKIGRIYRLQQPMWRTYATLAKASDEIQPPDPFRRSEFTYPMLEIGSADAFFSFHKSTEDLGRRLENRSTCGDVFDGRVSSSATVGSDVCRHPQIIAEGRSAFPVKAGAAKEVDSYLLLRDSRIQNKRPLDPDQKTESRRKQRREIWLKRMREEVAAERVRPCITCNQPKHMDRDCPLLTAMIGAVPGLKKACRKCLSSKHKTAHCHHSTGILWEIVKDAQDITVQPVKPVRPKKKTLDGWIVPTILAP